ncbi:DUF6056 family protein [Francisella adeliensis]|uniref:Glycosyltransferase RgtA/B/C/D-like domain-containing protein n=1 Tax=Francisella adeliensis TaxID=2007306 RepID=A0A2Z4Y065_9GAMM|nr:DUF6056 family protein [Francisella adeliensis]AXA34083.1 hypothetical protein CDH04_06520 [Francisella adeliensis]MBK2085248.1 hypothetical protein [Francisella adeliensis]MBK2095984.1 hypothetical protein [Francisella adeliensis]QIW12323.1 hypothetical protein FZC43_06520 [Francisella adeliensis]QIW14197.1 hypothetical protein FZC44_06520 [Francisella adeliensis]
MYKKSNKFSFCIIVFLFCYFFFLNYCQPLTMDDFSRATVDTLVNHSFFSWLYVDYTSWTGRISAQALVYILFSKTYATASILVINILNSIALSVFMIFSFKLVTRNRYSIKSKDFVFYAFLFMLMFGHTGFIGEAIWKTVAIQYFWGFTLLTVLFYYLLVKEEDYKVISLLVGLFIGIYNEQFVGVLMILCLAYFFERYLVKSRINIGVVFFAIGCFIGGMILVAAPGNYVRMDQMEPEHARSLFEQLKNFYSAYKNSLWPNTSDVTWLFVAFMALALTNEKNLKKSVFIYALALALSLIVMFPVIQSYGLLIRLMLIYYVVFFFAVLYQFYDSDNELIERAHFFIRKLYILPLIGLVIVLALLANTYFSLYRFHLQEKNLMYQYHAKNMKNITLPIFEQPNTKNFGITYGGITCNVKDPNNDAFAKYYGFKTVKAENC